MDTNQQKLGKNVMKIMYNREENGTVISRRKMDTMMCFRNRKIEGT